MCITDSIKTNQRTSIPNSAAQDRSAQPQPQTQAQTQLNPQVCVTARAGMRALIAHAVAMRVHPHSQWPCACTRARSGHVRAPTHLCHTHAHA
eukprot:2917887-Alexandrium_andersonii.AAC.1